MRSRSLPAHHGQIRPVAPSLSQKKRQDYRRADTGKILTDVISFQGSNTAETVSVTVATKAELLRQIADRLTARQGFTVATLNLDHIVKLQRDAAFRSAYCRHTHVVADGNPIVWLQRLAGRPVGLVPGSELVEPLAALAAQMDVPVALLGSTTEALNAAAARLEASFPGLRVVAKIAPPFGFDPSGPMADACLDEIGKAGARLCFLALGAPKQELLAVRGLDRLPDCGFLSIGAGLDFIAGHQKRAPLWVRNIAMEWAWRMIGNPKRLVGRYSECAAILPGLGLAALRARRLRNG